jgi:hypothetical protein
MNEPYFILKPPRPLTKIEVVDIHLLVMASRPILMPPPKVRHAPKA